LNRTPPDLSLRNRLIRLIEENNPEMAAPLRDDTSLIRSGLIDSMGLFNIALWIERESGTRLDPNAFDPARDWDTVADIVSFVKALPAGFSGIKGMPYDVVPYRPEKMDEVVELHANFWGDISLSAAYLEWKYERNPYPGESRIYLALSEGKPVGMRGIYGALLEAGSPPQRFLGLHADDLVVAPGHRGRGVQMKIMRAVFDDLREKSCEYLFSLSAGAVTRFTSRAMGWRNVGHVGEVRRVSPRVDRLRRLRESLSGIRFFRGYADGIRRLEEKSVLSDIRGRKIKRPIKVGPHVSLWADPRPVEMARLVERMPYDGRIRHVRDCAYFTWRFQNPVHKYWFLFWEEPDLEGYLVLQEYMAKNMDKTVTNIVDWEASNERIRAGLLKAALRLGHFPDLRIWSGTLPDRAKALLADAGFRPEEDESGINDQRKRILVKPLLEGTPESSWVLADRRWLDLADWDVRMVYSMQG
jgi:acyl carrier protein/GNAT superfamily N-acetyltransferase